MGQKSCPSCPKLLTADFTSKNDGDQSRKTTIKGFRSSSIINRINHEDFQTSTKIEALVCIVNELPFIFLIFFGSLLFSKHEYFS